MDFAEQGARAAFDACNESPDAFLSRSSPSPAIEGEQQNMIKALQRCVNALAEIEDRAPNRKPDREDGNNSDDEVSYGSDCEAWECAQIATPAIIGALAFVRPETPRWANEIVVTPNTNEG
jgi:hypothetical protein